MSDEYEHNDGGETPARPGSHRRQIDEGVEKSLAFAGIPRELFRRTLADFQHPRSAELVQWVLSGSRGNRDGFNFVGGNDAEEMALLVARGLHLVGRTVRAMPLLRYYERISNERYELRSYLESADTLLLTQAGPYTIKEEVFSKRELWLIEMGLTEWIGDCRRLLIHTPLEPIAGRSSWFSHGFLQRVAKLNSVITV